MPLMNSTGALKQQSTIFSVSPLYNQQWIAEMSLTGYTTAGYALSKTGNSYFVTPNTMGVTKLNNIGSEIFTFGTAGTGYVGVAGDVICTDNGDNVYVGGQDGTSPGNFPLIVKYNSSGTIVWQESLNTANFSNIISMTIVPTGDLFVLTGSSAGGSPASGSGPYVMFRIDSSTGAIINQRKILKATTSAPSDMYVDNITSKLLVIGTDYQSHEQILIGSYDFTNTDTPTLIYQSSTTDDYETLFAGANVQNCVSDGTYTYMVAYRIISGATKSIYQKVDNAGTVSYSNTITISGNMLTLSTITIDNNGYIYIVGSSIAGTYLMKISTSTGAIVWNKLLNFGINDIFWQGNFLYMLGNYSAGFPTFNVYQSIIKLNADGSLPNGTYATRYTFSTSPAATLTALNPQSVGTTAGSVSTTAYTKTTSTMTTSSSTLTISTTNIP